MASQDPDDILSAYQAKLDEVVTAVEASDWSNAYIKLTAAKAIRAKLIESEISDNDSRLHFSDDLLKSMTDMIAQAESSASKHSGSRFGYSSNRYGSGYR